MREKREVLVIGILDDVRVRRAEQGDEDVDENDNREEAPCVVDDQTEWVPETLVGRAKVGRAARG